jgi:hypothetical protein
VRLVTKRNDYSTLPPACQIGRKTLPLHLLQQQRFRGQSSPPVVVTTRSFFQPLHTLLVWDDRGVSRPRGVTGSTNPVVRSSHDGRPRTPAAWTSSSWGSSRGTARNVEAPARMNRHPTGASDTSAHQKAPLPPKSAAGSVRQALCSVFL